MENQNPQVATTQPELPKQKQTTIPAKTFLFLVIFILLVAVGIGAYFLSVNYLKPPSQSSTTPVVAKPTTSVSSNETYTNNELGLSFAYPATWGKLQENDEDCLPSGGPVRQINGKPCVHVQLYAIQNGKKEYFFDAESIQFAMFAPGRGATNGDKFLATMKGITTPEDLVKNYCLPANRTGITEDLCQVSTNPQGILYAKAVDVYTMDGSKALFYYIYHPNHQFPGIVLSTNNMSSASSQTETGKVFDAIISSFTFINQTQSTGTIDTSSWKTYTHSDHTFSFQYPPSWSMSSPLIQSTHTEYDFPPSSFSVRVGFTYSQTLQRELTFDEEVTNAKTNADQIYFVSVGGKQVQEFLYNKSSATPSEEVLIPNGKTIVAIRMTVTNSTDADEFGKILSTFTFLQ